MAFSSLNVCSLLTNFNICISSNYFCHCDVVVCENNPLLAFPQEVSAEQLVALSSRGEWSCWECWKWISAPLQPGASILGFHMRIHSCHKCLVADLDGELPQSVRPPCRQRAEMVLVLLSRSDKTLWFSELLKSNVGLLVVYRESLCSNIWLRYHILMCPMWGQLQINILHFSCYMTTDIRRYTSGANFLEHIATKWGKKIDHVCFVSRKSNC